MIKNVLRGNTMVAQEQKHGHEYGFPEDDDGDEVSYMPSDSEDAACLEEDDDDRVRFANNNNSMNNASSSTLTATAHSNKGKRIMNAMNASIGSAAGAAIPSPGTNGTASAAATEQEVLAVQRFARKDTRNVRLWRFVVVLLMAAVGGLLSAAVYLFLRREQYDDVSASWTLLTSNAKSTAVQRMGVIFRGTRGLSETVTAAADATNGTFPYFSVNAFEVSASHAMDGTGAEKVSYCPAVLATEREDWEAYSLEHAAAWLRQTASVQRSRGAGPGAADRAAVVAAPAALEPPPTKSALTLSDIMSPVIYDSADGNATTGEYYYVPAAQKPIYLPVWQYSPVSDAAPRMINFNLIGNETNAGLLRTVGETREPVFSEIRDFPFLFSDVDGNSSSDSNDVARSLLMQPVFDYVRSQQQQQQQQLEQDLSSSFQQRDIVGVIAAVIPWTDALLRDLLPPPSTTTPDGGGLGSSDAAGKNSIVYGLLENSCGQTITYALHGNEVSYVGEGDVRDSASKAPELDAMKVTIPLVTTSHFYRDDNATIINNNNNNNNNETTIPYYCDYHLSVYPSKVYYDAAVAAAGSNPNAPALACTAVAVVFAVTIAAFCVYDRFVQRRNAKVIDAAARSNAIVSSMFPSQIRDRLFASASAAAAAAGNNNDDPHQQHHQDHSCAGTDNTHTNSNNNNNSSRSIISRNNSGKNPYPTPTNIKGTGPGGGMQFRQPRLSSINHLMCTNQTAAPKSRLKVFLNHKSSNHNRTNLASPRGVGAGSAGPSANGNGGGGGGGQSGRDDDLLFQGKPIADLFPDTTVIFADIAGFTAWSSVREPSQVFTLLETIYRAFDEIAKKRHVFKVETVGDCYVAVTGLPDPLPDHAVAMARFARDCMWRMNMLTKRLEVTLGPDTGDLTMRMGMHSGPVTAGVLRGERSRFQLFGDTMNTASRMESTGFKGRIQVSQETADLLVQAGKQGWVTARKETVVAKGKGEMQTYWLSQMSEMAGTGSSSMSQCSGDSVGETTPPGGGAFTGSASDVVSAVSDESPATNAMANSYIPTSLQQQQQENNIRIGGKKRDGSGASSTSGSSGTPGTCGGKSGRRKSKQVRCSFYNLSHPGQSQDNDNTDVSSITGVGFGETQETDRQGFRSGARSVSEGSLGARRVRNKGLETVVDESASSSTCTAHGNTTMAAAAAIAAASTEGDASAAGTRSNRKQQSRLYELTAAKKARLIDWNVDVLLRLLKQIVARRRALVKWVGADILPLPGMTGAVAQQLANLPGLELVKTSAGLVIKGGALALKGSTLAVKGSVYTVKSGADLVVKGTTLATSATTTVVKSLPGADILRKSAADAITGRRPSMLGGLGAKHLYAAHSGGCGGGGGGGDDDSSATSVPEQGNNGSTVLEEVREIITLPKFNAKAAKYQEDPEGIQLDVAVEEQLHDFVSNIAALYHDNPFHNFEHASHVTMSVVKLLSRIVAPAEVLQDFDMNYSAAKNNEKDAKKGKQAMASNLHDHTYGITSDPLTQFACVISALIHDVDHPGVPNAQLVKEGTRLATVYKGKSVAEQNSVDLAWELLMDESYAQLRETIFPTDSDLKRFRQLVVNSVMATDIIDKDLKQLRNARWDRAFSAPAAPAAPVVPQGAAESRDDINRKATIVIEHLIQASDVAHTMQHWHIYRKWNERFYLECFAAYREGRAEKNPAETWYQGELGFYDFYIIPLAKKLKDCGVFGVSSDEYLNYAVRNREEWEFRGQEIVAEMVELANRKLGLHSPAATLPLPASETPEPKGANVAPRAASSSTTEQAHPTPVEEEKKNQDDDNDASHQQVTMSKSSLVEVAT